MYEVVLAGCTWLEKTPWGLTIRVSSWMYPVVLWLHFVGLSMWLGPILTVDLRLMGIGARRQTAVELANALRRWKWIGFGVAFLGGFLLLSAEATVYVTNIGFWLKLGVAGPIALVWHLVVQKKMRAWTDTAAPSLVPGGAGIVEILLWISVVTSSVVFLLTNAVTHP